MIGFILVGKNKKRGDGYKSRDPQFWTKIKENKRNNINKQENMIEKETISSKN